MERFHRLALLALTSLAVASLLLVPSGAAPASEVDPIALPPNEAAEGKYAFQNEDGELRIPVVGGSEATADGIPTNSVVDLGPVFDVNNTDETATATVFVEHDSEVVTFYVPEHGPVESRQEGVAVGPESTQPIHILVNATGVEPGTVLEEMTVFVSMEQADESSEAFNADSDDSDDTTAAPTPDTPEPTTSAETSTVTDSPSPTPTTTPVSEPTPTDDSGGNDSVSADDQTDEVSGFGPTSLLGITLLLAGVIGTMLLFRRLRGV